jgi:hypothetical protein
MERRIGRRNVSSRKIMPLAVAGGGILAVFLLILAYDYSQRLRAARYASSRLGEIGKALDRDDCQEARRQLQGIAMQVHRARFQNLSEQFSQAWRRVEELRKRAVDQVLRELDQLCDKGDPAAVTFVLDENAVYEFDSLGPVDEKFPNEFSKALQVQAKMTNRGDQALAAAKVEGKVSLVLGDMMGLPVGTSSTDVSLVVPIYVKPGVTAKVPIRVPLSGSTLLAKGVSYTADFKLTEAFVLRADKKAAGRFVALTKKYEELGGSDPMAVPPSEGSKLPAKYRAYLECYREMLAKEK